MSPANDDIDLRSRIMSMPFGAISFAGEGLVRLRGPMP